MDLKELLGELYTAEIEAKLKDKVVLKSEQGNMIPKDRFDSVNKEKKEAKEKLAEVTKQLEGLSNSETTIEELKTKLLTIDEEHKTYVAKIEKDKINGDKESKLIEYLDVEQNVEDPELLLHFYDLDSLTFDGGKLAGHVAKTEELKNRFKGQFGVKKTKSPDVTMKFKDKLFKDMLPAEKMAFKQEDPLAYEKARNAHKIRR